MLKLKAIIILSLALFMLLAASCGVGSVSEQSVLSVDSSAVETDTEASVAVELDSLKIVALGDSIPRGYGLDDPESQRFPTKIANHFSGIYEDVVISNYAVDGMTSDGLLKLLEEQKQEMVKDADIILLCIGANNVLRHAYDLLYIGGSDAQSLLNAYGQFLVGDKSDTAAADALNNYFSAISAYSKGDEFGDKMNDGASLLRSNIPKIIAEIRSVNSNATVYFATVYNPYEGLNITLPYVENGFMLSDISDRCVGLLNTVINESATENGYTVVDIYTLFENDTGKNINAGFNFAIQSINYDPHPNLNGHTLIAQEFIRIITEDLA